MSGEKGYSSLRDVGERASVCSVEALSLVLGPRWSMMEQAPWE